MISIAIVEDEEMYAKQLQQFLHQYEEENKEMFDITVYSDGDQIVNKYKSQYDIILMDVEMKFMDGMSAAVLLSDHQVFQFPFLTESQIKPSHIHCDAHCILSCQVRASCYCMK